eukprot:126706-Prymnesium_polylepis.1
MRPPIATALVALLVLGPSAHERQRASRSEALCALAAGHTVTYTRSSGTCGCMFGMWWLFEATLLFRTTDPILRPVTDWGVLLPHGNSCGFCMTHSFNASIVTQHRRLPPIASY